MNNYRLPSNKLPSEIGLEPINVNVFSSKLGKRRVQLPTEIPEVRISGNLPTRLKGFEKIYSKELLEETLIPKKEIKKTSKEVEVE